MIEIQNYLSSNILNKKVPNPNDDLKKKWGMHFLIITKEAYIDGNEENE